MVHHVVDGPCVTVNHEECMVHHVVDGPCVTVNHEFHLPCTTLKLSLMMSRVINNSNKTNIRRGAWKER